MWKLTVFIYKKNKLEDIMEKQPSFIIAEKNSAISLSRNLYNL